MELTLRIERRCLVSENPGHLTGNPGHVAEILGHVTEKLGLVTRDCRSSDLEEFVSLK